MINSHLKVQMLICIRYSKYVSKIKIFLLFFLSFIFSEMLLIWTSKYSFPLKGTFKKIIICLKKKEIKKDLSGLNSWGIHREYGSSIWCSPINVKSLPFRHWSQLFINSLIINLYNLIARFRISKGFNNHLGQMILTVLCMASKTNVLKKNTSQFDGIFCSC